MGGGGGGGLGTPVTVSKVISEVGVIESQEGGIDTQHRATRPPVGGTIDLHTEGSRVWLSALLTRLTTVL